jgi:hypothetical protein
MGEDFTFGGSTYKELKAIGGKEQQLPAVSCHVAISGHFSKTCT